MADLKQMSAGVMERLRSRNGVAAYRRWQESSVANRITAALVGLALAVIVVIGLISYEVTERLLMRGIHDTFQSDGRLAQQGVEDTLGDLTRDLDALSRNSLVANALVDSQGRDAYLVPFLREYRASHGSVASLSLLDFSGAPIATSTATAAPTVTAVAPAPPAGKAPTESPASHDRPVPGTDVRLATGVVPRPEANASDVPLSVVSAKEATQWIEKGKPVALLREVKGHQDLLIGYPVIYGPTQSVEGMLLVRVGLAGLLQRPLATLPGEYEVEVLDAQGRAIFGERVFADHPAVITATSRLALPAPTDALGLQLKLSRRESELLAPLNTLKVWYLVFALVATAVMFWLSRRIARRVTQPLADLSVFASGIAEGGGTGPGEAPAAGNDEIGRLSASINRMLGVLREAQSDLQRRVEEGTAKLDVTRDRLESTLRSVRDVIYSVSVDRAHVRYMSPAAKKVFGRSETEFTATPGLWMENVYQADRPAILEATSASESTGMGECRYRVRAPGGGVRFIEDRFRMVYDKEGRPSRIEGIASDITDRVISEEERAMVEAVLNLKDRALQSSTSGIVMADLRLPDQPIVYVNPAFERMTGYAATDVYGQNCRFLQGDERDQKVLEEVRAAVRERRATTVVLRNYRKDGTPFWNELSIAPVADSSGEITHFVGVQTDITERRRAQAEVRERTARLDAIFALSPDGFVSFDAAGKVAFVNPAFSRMTGLDAAPLIGMDAGQFDLALGAQVDPTQPAAGLARQAIEELSREAVEDHADADGPSSGQAASTRRVLHLVAPERRVIEFGARSAHSEYSTLILYFRDVTRETEVDRMKSEFLSTAAHELRTPMASIRGFSELLLRRNYPEETRRDLTETILKQSERLTNLLNELLDLARIEARAGKDFRMKVQPLANLVEDTVAAVLMDNDSRKVNVSLGGEPVFVSIDTDKIAQALTNVISNAYKYSPNGGSIDLTLEKNAKGEVGIRVADQGLGMTPEQLSRAFERFFRADTSGNIPGTGLGLSLVKEIVEIHGGHVDITSEYGKGTVVTLWLPVAERGHGVLAA